MKASKKNLLLYCTSGCKSALFGSMVFPVIFPGSCGSYLCTAKEVGRKRSEAVESHEGFSLYDSGCGDYLPGWKPFILSDY